MGISIKKMIIPVITIIVIVGIIVFVKNTSKPQTSNAQIPAVLLTAPKKEINKEYMFEIPNDKTPLKVNYVIESVELLDEIVVQGQKAKAVEGRTFFILNLKIKNDNDQGIRINTRDFVRLTVEGNSEEKLAPDIHNDPVEIQAISTKYTRLGFPVNRTDRKFQLQVGEIDKEKIIINVNFE